MPTQSIRVSEFDTWRATYGGQSVRVYLAGTTTLASLFSNPDLTGALPNPQTLMLQVGADGERYGKFSQPVYVGTPYQLLIDETETTGIERLPIYDMEDVDASLATVQSDRGSVDRALEDWLDDTIQVEAYGVFLTYGATGASATDNTTTLNSAIGAASAQGGGRVLLPPGTYEFNTLSLPQGVVLQGVETGGTVLRSTQTQAVVTIAGNRAGLADLTLDGVNLGVGSIGVVADGRTDMILRDVIVKRFATGIRTKGGTRARLYDVKVDNCTNGVDIRGDDISAVATPARDFLWRGGAVSTCTTFGLRFSYQTAGCFDALVEGVLFDTNVGAALSILGAQQTQVNGCRWTGNTADIAIADNGDGEVAQAHFDHCSLSGGTIAISGTAEDVQFRGCSFADTDTTLTSPTFNVLFMDCTEDASCTTAGNTEKLLRNDSFKVGEAAGVTTDATETTAWVRALSPGEVYRARVRVLGRQRNGLDYLSHEMAFVARRPPSNLDFDTASSALQVGDRITGRTSGATARVVYVSSAGASGYLLLRDIDGEFTLNETCDLSSGQTCRATGTLEHEDALMLTTLDLAGPSIKSDNTWDIRADTNGETVRVRVTGAGSKTIEWLVEVDEFRP